MGEYLAVGATSAVCKFCAATRGVEFEFYAHFPRVEIRKSQHAAKFAIFKLIQLALSFHRNPQNVSSFLNLLYKIAIELTFENFHQTSIREWCHLSRS